MAKSVRELLDLFQKKELTLDQTEQKIRDAITEQTRASIIEELADKEVADLIRDMKKECQRVLEETPVE